MPALPGARFPELAFYREKMTMQEITSTLNDSGRKRPIDILREKRGGVSESLKEYVKNQNRIKRLLHAALKTGPMTIPQLAAHCQLEPSVLLWHLMAMRRYGEVVEGQEQDGYYLYLLKEN
jgi:hypothetical protein